MLRKNRSWKKQTITFTHEETEVTKWEILQTLECCSRDSTQAKACACSLHNPEDLFLRYEIQFINNLVWQKAASHPPLKTILPFLFFVM